MLLAGNAGADPGAGLKTEVAPTSQSSLRFTALENGNTQILLLTIPTFPSGKENRTGPLNISFSGTEEELSFA